MKVNYIKDEESRARLFKKSSIRLSCPSYKCQLFLFPQKVGIHPLCSFCEQILARGAFVAALQRTTLENMYSNLGSQPVKISSSCFTLIGRNGAFDFPPLKTFRKCIIFCEADL